jgi:hypothetical protein
MDLFPLHDGNRKAPSAPGARKAVYSVEDAAGVVRDALAHLEREGLTAALFPALTPDAPADDDPDPGPVLGLCGPRLRFNRTRGGTVYRMFAVDRWINGVNGYAVAPSDWRPGLSVWSHSEGHGWPQGPWTVHPAATHHGVAPVE